ncbi:MAG: iron-containing alcohol dehydrogenase [Bacteroidia bacterium]|nr:iron-containing alcohol dehydrogenase [Bacteroidia bacterium]
MVKPFQFSSIPRIYFKCGSLSLLPALIKTYGNSVILVTSKQSFIDSVYATSLFQKFKDDGIKYQTVIIENEPSPEVIDQNVNKLKKELFDAVVGIGGGSILDAGKAISAMMYKDDSVLGYLEGVGTKEHPGTKLPFIAVPTTSGTGSEATKNAVISRVGKDGFKRSLRHDNFVPNIAVVDPELTLSCPPAITAASGMDCFTQLTEAYLSDKSNEYTDTLAIEGLKAIKASLVASVINGQDLEARTDMSFAALTSGICLANAGLGVVHGFASSIGGRYNIPHGVICGTLMSVSNELTVRKLRQKPDNQLALKKYAFLGKLFLNEEGKNDDHYIDGFVDHLHDLTNTLKLTGLKELGIKEDDLMDIAMNTECKNNPVKLDNEELLEILKARFI